MGVGWGGLGVGWGGEGGEGGKGEGGGPSIFCFTPGVDEKPRNTHDVELSQGAALRAHGSCDSLSCAMRLGWCAERRAVDVAGARVFVLEKVMARRRRQTMPLVRRCHVQREL